MMPKLPINLDNVREWFPAPRTENPFVGTPWWQIRGLGLFAALQIMRVVPDTPERQAGLIELRRCIDTLLKTVHTPSDEEVRRIMARNLAPYVPTAPEVVNAMLDMAKLNALDLVYDLGCGDGRIAIEAVRRGSDAVGIDIDQVFIDECNSRLIVDGQRPAFVCADIMDVDFTNATVITCYLVRSTMNELQQKFRQCRPGTRIISHAFMMDGWEPTEVRTVNDSQIFLWIV